LAFNRQLKLTTQTKKMDVDTSPQKKKYFAESLPVFMMLALLVGLFYLTASARGVGFLGFPLDDAWIHQTYARNLAESGQLAFVPGHPSAGSTAPLWTALLSVGYWLGAPFKFWAYSLGLALLGLTGWTVARLGTRLFPEYRWLGLLAGLFCLFEWHLVWAAVSGMETMLFVWLSVWLVERYVADRRRNFWAGLGLGLLGGLLILTRPEGVVLLGLLGLDAARRLWTAGENRAAFVRRLGVYWTGLTAGMLLLLGPYVTFHLWLTGEPLPSTFYAKQAEYAVILESFPLWWRLFGSLSEPIDTVQGVFRVVFIGPQILLLPGLVVAAMLTINRRRDDLALLWLWWLGFLLMYGLRLPVTYQHGRYQIPAIPWLVLLGIWGTVWIVQQPCRRSLARRVIRRALAISVVLLVPAFTVIGAQAYARDVRIIETEMVAAARWLSIHVSSEAVIAAHDIGAIGYYTRRPLLDLAGLITPEIIPIIRDETALLDFIQTRQADYLVTFPSWYPKLTRSPALTLIYSTGAPWSKQAGGDNMAVYRLAPAENEYQNSIAGQQSAGYR